MLHNTFCRRLAALVLTLAVAVSAVLPVFAVYPMPVQTATETEAVYLFNADTGKTILSQNADQQKYVASLTKLMTALLLVVLILLVLLLLCPFCADVCWENDTLTVKAGALGITFPVFQYPKPEAPAQPEESKGFTGRLKAKFRAWRAERKRKKAEKKAAQPAKPKAEKPPRQKAKITLDVICTMLRGVGTLLRAVFGALRFTRISVCLGVRGDDPAAAARSYGKLNAWLGSALGLLDRFLYLDFEQLRLVPDLGSDQPTVENRVSFRVTAQAYAIVFTALRVLYEFWREKVLDLFL